MYPDVSVVKRMGEVNAWDNEEFREAVRATNKSQIIMAGIVTDVCKWEPKFSSPSTLLSRQDNLSNHMIPNNRHYFRCSLSP